MSHLIDLADQRFGRLHIIKRAPNYKSGAAMWLCQCDCGNKTIVHGVSLRDGDTQSCGCLQGVFLSLHNATHAASYSRLYRIWCSMRHRCNAPRAGNFKYYGGRGIKVCKAWQKFEPFRDWALKHGYQDDLTIDRINNDGDYTPSNCQWITAVANLAKRHRDAKQTAKPSS